MSNTQIPRLIPPSTSSGSRQFSQKIAALMTPRIRLIGDGPCEASPSHVLDKPLCWDVNGFYRRLGVPTSATKGEIRKAYLDMNGESSSLLTKAVEVLTNKRTRPIYDSMPFGWFWPDDEQLTKMITDEEFESPGDEQWSFYVDHTGMIFFEHLGADAATDALNAWRVAIAYEMWARGFTESFAMGVSDEMSVAIVGRRIVAFVPLTLKISTEYAAQVASVAETLRAADT